MTETTKPVGTLDEGFDTPVKAPKAGADFLSLKDGEKAAVRLLAMPVKFKEHWSDLDRRSTICTKQVLGQCDICDDPARDRDAKYARFRFGVPVYVHALLMPGAKEWDAIGEVRIFEQGARCLDSLKAAVDETEDWRETDFTITRMGAGTDTKYMVIPRPKKLKVPDSAVAPDLKAYYMGKILSIAGKEAGPSLADIAASETATPHDIEPGSLGDPFADQ